MLKREELLKLFETAGAIRHGHFELSSGLHSGTYVQCALVLQYPRFAEKLGQALAALFSDVKIEAVVSPAIGGRQANPKRGPKLFPSLSINSRPNLEFAGVVVAPRTKPLSSMLTNLSSFCL